MPIYTSAYFRNLSESFTGKAQINEAMRSSERARNLGVDKNTRFDIFLSHSYLDQEEVYGIYLDLTKQGFSVYVDWIIDSHLDRKKVTKQSAELIRHRMKCSSSLLLAFSINSQLSRWIPWELGYVDGHTFRCALIPVSSNSHSNTLTFNRYEYLLLYPYLKSANLRGISDKAYVVNGSREYIDLNGWVRQKRAPEKQELNIDFL